MPVPICWASASAVERRSSAISRSANPSGMMFVTCLPEELVARVAELLLGLHVQQHDLAAWFDHDHRVGRGLEQPAVAALHLRQVLLGRLAHADVADRGGDQDARRRSRAGSA